MSLSLIRTLVVASDPVVLGPLPELLAWRHASTPAAALTAIERESPELLIVADDAPRVDALAICRALGNGLGSESGYVLVLLPSERGQHAAEMLASGADACLPLPVVPALLAAQLSAARRSIEQQRRLRRMAHHDALTGLPNRRAFDACCAQEVARARRYGRPLACALIDADGFKQVNDTRGHAAGDALLVRLAQVLRGSCRASDMVFRLGGDEFCVLLPETRAGDAQIWAERVRDELARGAADDLPGSAGATVSIGVAELADDVDGAQTLVDRTDQALLAAKRAGRNRVMSFGPSVAHHS